MKLPLLNLFPALLLTATMALTGCGDTNILDPVSESSGDQAKTEEGIAALDEQNWTEAIEIFSELPDSEDKRKYLSSAYLGQAGFDTLELVALADEAADTGSTDVLWESIGAIFDGAENDGLLTQAEIDDMLFNTESALSVLLTNNATTDYVGYSNDWMDDNRIFQTGVSAAVHAVLSISAQLVTGSGEIVINPDTYAGTIPDPATVPATLNADLALVADAVAQLDAVTDADVVADFNDFLVDIGYAGDNNVSLTDLRGYISTL